MNLVDVVREYFPAATDNQAWYVLWECTGYPAFWDIPKSGATPEECLRKQLAEARDRSCANCELACAMCNEDMERAMNAPKGATP